MNELTLYLLKTYGIVFTAAIVIAFVAWKAIDKYYTYRLEIGKLKTANDFELAKMQKEVDLKLEEEDKKVRNVQRFSRGDMVRVFHEMIDRLLKDVEIYWVIENKKSDPKYCIDNIREHVGRMITYARSNTRILGIEFSGYIEGRLAEMVKLLYVDWEECGHDSQGLLFGPTIKFTDKDRKKPEAILRELMEKINDLVSIE